MLPPLAYLDGFPIIPWTWKPSGLTGEHRIGAPESRSLRLAWTEYVRKGGARSSPQYQAVAFLDGVTSAKGITGIFRLEAGSRTERYSLERTLYEYGDAFWATELVLAIEQGRRLRLAEQAPDPEVSWNKRRWAVSVREKCDARADGLVERRFELWLDPTTVRGCGQAIHTGVVPVATLFAQDAAADALGDCAFGPIVERLWEPSGEAGQGTLVVPGEPERVEARWRAFASRERRSRTERSLVELRWLGRPLAMQETYDSESITNSGATRWRFEASRRRQVCHDALAQALRRGETPKLVASPEGLRLSFPIRNDHSFHEVDIEAIDRDLVLDLGQRRGRASYRYARDVSN